MPAAVLARLAHATKVPVEWLLTGEGAPSLAAPAPEASSSLSEAMSAISADAHARESAVSGARSIWQMVDFDALVMCLELQEGLDRLGGGEIKSVKSRLRRAFNAYDLKKNDPE